MQGEASQFDPSSYAAQLAVPNAGSGHRLKSEYGRALEARRRRGSTNNNSSRDAAMPAVAGRVAPRTVTSSPPRRLPVQELTSPPHWRSVRESEHSARHASARTLHRTATPDSSPSRRASAVASAHTPKRHFAKGSAAPSSDNGALSPFTNTSLQDSASVLLSQLQQVVVQISQQIVHERQHAGQQQEQISALETVVQEQDALLDQLRQENEALLHEKAHMMKTYQRELKKSVEHHTPVKATPTAALPPSVPSTAITAAEVDRCVAAEFERLAPAPYVRHVSLYGTSSPANPFDDVSPAVAAVLRSLASQVLQWRQAKGHTNGSAESAPARRELVRSVPETASTAQPPSSHAHDAAGSVLAQEKHVPASPPQGGTPRRDTVVEQNHAASLAAPHDRYDRVELIRVNPPPAASANGSGDRVPPVAARRRSASTASADSSVYEDAASILSDIRARYGL